MLRRASKVIWFSLGMLYLGMTGSAIAHGGPELLVPESDFVVKWYQPHAEIPVQNWDIEIFPQEGNRRSYIRTAQVFADDSCWAVNVPVDREARVRIRAVSGGGTSPWSPFTVVPEPAFALSTGVSAGLLTLLARRRARRNPL